MLVHTVLFLFMAAGATTIFPAQPLAQIPAQALPGTPYTAGSDSTANDEADPAELAQGEKPVVYRPPLRGAPTRRVGGATRGDVEWDVVLSVLAPEATGLTARASPDLYWYLSKADSRPTVFALIRDDRVEPVIEVTLGERTPGGIGKLALADADVRLEPGVIYDWSIALVTDPETRSKDVVSSATILFRAPDPNLERELESADLAAKAALYAGAGYWYDAIGTLSSGIDQGVDIAPLRSIRADLLDQVGLDDAAAFERGR